MGGFLLIFGMEIQWFVNSKISWGAGRVLLSGLSGVREGQEVGGVAKCAAGKRSSWMNTKVEGMFRNWACPKCQNPSKRTSFKLQVIGKDPLRIT